MIMIHHIYLLLSMWSIWWFLCVFFVAPLYLFILDCEMGTARELTAYSLDSSYTWTVLAFYIMGKSEINPRKQEYFVTKMIFVVPSLMLGDRIREFVRGNVYLLIFILFSVEISTHLRLLWVLIMNCELYYWKEQNYCTGELDAFVVDVLFSSIFFF